MQDGVLMPCPNKEQGRSTDSIKTASSDKINMSYQLYRNTTLGNSLQESLDELIQVIKCQVNRSLVLG